MVYHLAGDNDRYTIMYHTNSYTIKYGKEQLTKYFNFIHPLNTIVYEYTEWVVCGNIERYIKVFAPEELQSCIAKYRLWTKIPVDLILTHIHKTVKAYYQGT